MLNVRFFLSSSNWSPHLNYMRCQIYNRASQIRIPLTYAPKAEYYIIDFGNDEDRELKMQMVTSSCVSCARNFIFIIFYFECSLLATIAWSYR